MWPDNGIVEWRDGSVHVFRNAVVAFPNDRVHVSRNGIVEWCDGSVQVFRNGLGVFPDDCVHVFRNIIM